MEDKEEPAVKTRAGFQGKSGWMKKAHGRVLSSYKDRYVSVDKTEILVYENEDQKNCLERVDLENYDKCHEMKSGFKKKHKLVLIRSPKSANKVHDLKFQAQSAEEKDAWIKALSDAINRAKNKIFDEVKVDESSNLEHVTRTRPKGNRGRRPPTRIHMKEVADVSSDGILRLDLDLENAMMPNGTHSSAVDGTENHKETAPSPSSSDSTENKTLSTLNEAEDEDQSQKVLKPPMPPSKQTATIEEGTEEEEVPEKKILKPPMPPSKDVKPSDTDKTDKTPETSPDSKKKIPPMPPNKPLSSIITPIEPSPSKTTVHPPTPPSKEKKPSASAEISQDSTENSEEEKVDKTDSEKDIADEAQVTPPTPAKSPKLPAKQEDLPKSDVPTTIDDEEESKDDVPVVQVCLKDSESVDLSPLLGPIPGEDKETKAEEKSLDSGQHSDEDGLEDSVSEDASPTRDSNNDLDALDSQSSKTEISISLKPQICSSKGYTAWNKPPTPLKPNAKVRSASSGNLLSESSDFNSGSSTISKAVEVRKLETEVALEMEDTSDLLNKASRAQTVLRGDKNPENLLAEAMEKLKRADHVLREVKKLKLVKDTNRRKSW